MDELLALLGQNWRALLLYPGGLTIFGATAIIGFMVHGRDWWQFSHFSSADMAIVATWLIVVALLPLPQTGWPYNLDVLTVLLLIELLYASRVIRRREETAVTIIADLLNSYPLLVLAVAALGQGSGSLVIREINRSTGALHWLGIVAWSITLPPLLSVGPWRTAEQPHVLHMLRQVVHMALLLALALPAHDASPRIHTFVGFFAIALPLAAIHRWWDGKRSHWIRWQLWIVVFVALLIAALSGQQLLGRLS